MQKFNFERQINADPIDITGPNGEEEHVVLGLFSVEKTFQGESKTSRFVTIGNTDDGVFKDSNVRLYLPLRNAYEPTDEELIKLFTGGQIFIKDLPKKNGGTYSASFIFDMYADRSFTNRFGKKQTPNFTGELKFAPRKTKKADPTNTEEDFW